MLLQDKILVQACPWEISKRQKNYGPGDIDEARNK